ncbi:conserved hypothetical protein [Ricinus communis]|uniref:Uncharacterized protein n=1 Tax=Ricinus communis TaxID=3988 RepID=B9T891_RICCO|nr:conserved hypothetical protein [Ricinus communis]
MTDHKDVKGNTLRSQKNSGKLSRRGTPMVCNKCNWIDHNKTGCKNEKEIRGSPSRTN